MDLRWRCRAGARRRRPALKLLVLARGKAGHGPEQALVDRYLARLPGNACCRELTASAPWPPAARGSRTVVLDERGEALPSTAFAARLRRWQDEGVDEVRFLIGAADGHAAAVRQKADLVLSFGPATWPHLLVRAMLAEQLYRAWSILAGHPYHRQ